MINFNEPIVIDKGLEYIREAVVKYKHITGDGVFTKKCANWFEEKCMFNSFLFLIMDDRMRPSPIMCFCPITSSIVPGLSLDASGSITAPLFLDINCLIID